jgi:cytochrome P450
VSPDLTPTIRYYDDLDCWVAWGDAARQALEDRRLSSQTFEVANLNYLPADMHSECAHLIETLRRWFVLLDGDQHVTARRAIQPLFSPRRIRELQEVIHVIVTQALADFDRAGTADAASDLASPISARAVAHVLGLPGIDREWARALADFLAASYRRECALRAQQALRDMEDFIKNVPDADGDGIWARSGSSDRDRLATSSMMLFGGLETTGALIAFSLWYMLSHQLQGSVAASPAGQQATAIVERVLEHYAPLGHVARVATDEVALAGRRIARGELVLVSLGGGDPFQPGQLAGRPVSHHDGYRVDHLAFGLGMHYCVGAPLARLTAVTALSLFARRYPHASVREVRWRKNRTYPGFEHLYLDLTAS